MSEVKSPLVNKKVYGKPLKTFDVHSAEEEQEINNFQPPMHQTPSQMPQQTKQNNFNNDLDSIKKMEEAAERRRRAVSGRERLSKGALDRLSLLLGITQVKSVVNLGNDVVFELRSLKSEESREVLKIASSVTRLETPFELRRQYLARSVVSISNVDIDTFIGSSDLEDKLLFIDELDDAVASRLYNEFVLLKQRADAQYAIKSEDDAKEVVDNLKKS